VTLPFGVPVIRSTGNEGNRDTFVVISCRAHAGPTATRWGARLDVRNNARRTGAGRARGCAEA
jgi:hypothetical protein